MTSTEQNEFIESMMEEQLNDVKENIKTRFEALNFAVGYLLAALKLGALTIDEETKASNEFKAKLEGIKNEKV